MGLLHPSSWKRLVQSFNALQIHQLGKPERQQPQLRHFLPQSKILVNKWPSQRGDRAKIYLVEHVQYIYIYASTSIYIYIIYMCVCVCTSTNQSKTHKIGGEKKSNACRATPRPAMLSRCLKKSKAKARAVPTQRNIGRKTLLYIVSNPQKKAQK